MFLNEQQNIFYKYCDIIVISNVYFSHAGIRSLPYSISMILIATWLQLVRLFLNVQGTLISKAIVYFADKNTVRFTNEISSLSIK